MGNKRRNFDPSFKAKVALEALRERKTLSELASQYDLHPNQIANWKQQLLDQADELFVDGRKKRKKDDHEALEAQLYQQIGQLKVENDWLKKKSATLK